MSKSYTAIIYFHGIGTQRRHEEISRLLDAVDQFSRSQDAQTVGHPRGQDVKLEVPRNTNADLLNKPVSYIEFHRRVEVSAEEKARAKADGRREPSPFRGYFRLYEGYWSSLIAKGLAPRRVLLWIAGRATNPLRSLLAPWRSHQRLKLGYLFRMQREDPLGATARHSAYRQLADTYIAYEGWDARRNHSDGKFRTFRADYLASTRIAERKDFKSIRRLASRWHRRFILSQLRILFLIITLFAGLFGAATFAMFSVAPLISASVLRLPYADQVVVMLPAQPQPIVAYIMLPVLMVGWWGLSGFLRNYASDIVFWTAQEGQSDLFEMREKILRQAVDNLHHVISDPECRRVVVIGHSLGSSIGYQALLEIGNLREALGRRTPEGEAAFPYEKISHFITAGSPIETLHYFFELTDSKHHRYNRIANKIKGSIEGPPFTVGRSDNIKWINLHAAADPISSELYAPGKSKTPRIEEIEIVNQLQPDIALAHSGYFTATTAVSRIHDAMMLNDETRTDVAPVNRLARALANLGVRAFHLSLATGSWLIFIAAVCFWLGFTQAMNVALYVFFGTIGATVLGWLALAGCNRFFRLRVSNVISARERR